MSLFRQTEPPLSAVMDRDCLAVTPEGRRVQATVTPFVRRYGEKDKSAKAATMAAQSASATVISPRQLAVLADRPITSVYTSLSDSKTSGHGEWHITRRPSAVRARNQGPGRVVGSRNRRGGPERSVWRAVPEDGEGGAGPGAWRISTAGRSSGTFWAT